MSNADAKDKADGKTLLARRYKIREYVFGRPAIYTDPNLMAERAAEYFETNPVPTWDGLAIHLGFRSDRSLLDYQALPEFAELVGKLRTLYTAHLSEVVRTGAEHPGGALLGAVFTLKNFAGWRDTPPDQNSNAPMITYNTYLAPRPDDPPKSDG